MKAEYSSMRSLEEAMVRSCHTGTAVALGGGGGAKGSKPATNTHTITKMYKTLMPTIWETYHRFLLHTYSVWIAVQDLIGLGTGAVQKV